jgi:hypothetical protein
MLLLSLICFDTVCSLVTACKYQQSYTFACSGLLLHGLAHNVRMFPGHCPLSGVDMSTTFWGLVLSLSSGPLNKAGPSWTTYQAGWVEYIQRMMKFFVGYKLQKL